MRTFCSESKSANMERVGWGGVGRGINIGREGR